MGLQSPIRLGFPGLRPDLRYGVTKRNTPRPGTWRFEAFRTGFRDRETGIFKI